MAGFAVGDVVSMTLYAQENLSGLLGPLVQAQPPKFGIVAAGSGGPPFTTVDVLWEDGSVVTTVPVTALDKIGAPDPGVVGNLQGFLLKTNPGVPAQAESPEYQGVSVTFYTRQLAGAGTATDTLCLMHTNVGLYRELLAAALTVVAGR
jgi:hypothetical protein